jgi:hypothetical protein
VRKALKGCKLTAKVTVAATAAVGSATRHLSLRLKR